MISCPKPHFDLNVEFMLSQPPPPPHANSSRLVLPQASGFIKAALAGDLCV